MNLIEALMAADEKAINAPKRKEYEVKRLSNALGTPFIITLKEISPRRFTEIQNTAVKFDKKGRHESTDLYEVSMLILTEGIETKFFDKELLAKYGCATVKDFFGKIFNLGEISEIANAINKLSGIDPESREALVEEVKNA